MLRVDRRSGAIGEGRASGAVVGRPATRWNGGVALPLGHLFLLQGLGDGGVLVLGAAKENIAVVAIFDHGQRALVPLQQDGSEDHGCSIETER